MFLPNVFFLFHNPIEATLVHLITMSLRFLLAMAVSQTSLVFDDISIFE